MAEACKKLVTEMQVGVGFFALGLSLHHGFSFLGLYSVLNPTVYGEEAFSVHRAFLRFLLREEKCEKIQVVLWLVTFSILRVSPPSLWRRSTPRRC